MPVARLVPVGRRPSAVEAEPGLDRAARLRRFLEQEVWSELPSDERGRRMSRDEEDAMLGYGPQGV